MCGIFGYIGSKNCNSILIEGLKKLEYRGYDSVGVAISNGNKLSVIKKRGRVSSIEEEVMGVNGNIGIGLEWAIDDINIGLETRLKYMPLKNELSNSPKTSVLISLKTSWFF